MTKKFKVLLHRHFFVRDDRGGDYCLFFAIKRDLLSNYTNQNSY